MIQCSSDPNSTLNRLRQRLHDANKAMGGSGDKRKAATERNHALSALREVAHAIRGQKPKRLPVDFTTRACGIPCGVVIEYYSGDVDETEYTICTTQGHRMDWLDKRVHADTEEDAEIALQIMQYRQEMAP